MTLTLYHCTGSRSMRPLWTLEEMELDFELVSMQFPPRYTYEGYKDINILGTVPAFSDGELTMTESAGISQYLVEKYGPTPLGVGRDEDDYGLFLNWLHRSDATLTFPQTIVLRYSVLEPEERRLPQAVEDYRKWFLARMRSVEEATASRDYLCADRFTVADICVGYAIHLALSLKIEEVLTPNVEKYWQRISSRPAFERACR